MFSTPTLVRSAVAAGILALGAASAAQAAVTSHPHLMQVAAPAATAIPFTYTTLDDPADPTFNQLLGINDNLKIAGYFGSGAPGHPNQGYEYVKGSFNPENFPGSVQTQVTAINTATDTAGFYIDGKGVQRGFVQWNGVFASYVNPKTGKGTVNQLLGINNAGIAVGFYTDAKGVNHAYAVNQATSVYTSITPPGVMSAIATGISNLGDVTGNGVTANGDTVSWLLKGGHFSEFLFPGSTNTQAFGINSNDVIVGFYLDASGASHGFRLANPLNHAVWQELDDPNGIGNTFANGVNDHGDIVGFYVDAAGNTDGFVAIP